MADANADAKLKIRIISLLAIIAAVLTVQFIWNSNPHDVTITVTEKAANHGSDGKYLIYGVNESNENIVLTIKDVEVFGKMNSSDIYGQIREGETYTFEVTGHRSHILSEYENISQIKEHIKHESTNK